MSEINLISEQKERITKLKKKVRLLRIISFSCLIFVLISSVLVFLVKFSSPLPSLGNQEKALSGTLDGSKQKIGKMFVINDRLKSIDSILLKRSNFNEMINTLIQNKPGDLLISFLTINKNTIAMRISSMSLRSIDNFIDSIMTLTKDKKMFKKITLENLSVDMGTNSYAFSMKIDLP